MNKAIIIGFLGADPKLEVLANDSICTFSVATRERMFTLPGEKTGTQWFQVVAWGKLARVCSKYLFKGSHVAVEGSFQTRAFKDRTGKKRTTTEIVACDVDFLDRSKKTSDGGLPL